MVIVSISFVAGWKGEPKPSLQVILDKKTKMEQIETAPYNTIQLLAFV